MLLAGAQYSGWESLEVALHPIDTDRDSIDQTEALRVLREEGREVAMNNMAKPDLSQGGELGLISWPSMDKTQPVLLRRRHFQDQVMVLCVRWYLRYCLTSRDLEELMAERGLAVDHSTIGRWMLRSAPELHKRIRRDTRAPNRSWRVDETYVRMAGSWTYLYRAVDSNGGTIDFMLSPKRDAVAAKNFLRMASWRVGGLRPRVINVDGNPACPQANRELKTSGELSRHCRCRTSAYLNNVLEQDHRFLKRRMKTSLWFRSLEGALKAIAGYEAMNMIRKGQIRWLAKGDFTGQVNYIEQILGIAA